MPGNVPVDDAAVATELVSNLSEVWPPIIHRDVDGEDSTPRAIDLQYPNLNQYAATRRVARTVLLGSAPSLNSANRGIEIQRIRLGSVLPGEQVSVFNDALAKLVARATYLYNEGTRYWYGTQAHVGQLARDVAGGERPLVVGRREGVGAFGAGHPDGRDTRIVLYPMPTFGPRNRTPVAG